MCDTDTIEPTRNPSDSTTDPAEVTFFRVYRALEPVTRKALAAAIDAAPGERYQAAYAVLGEVYDDPEDVAQKAAELGALLAPSTWKQPDETS